MIKTELWYDIGCCNCGRHLSTDFGKGMTRTAKEARSLATKVGFIEISNYRALCPLCAAVILHDVIKETM